MNYFKKYIVEMVLSPVFIFSTVLLITKNLWYDELLTTPLIFGYNFKDLIFELRYDAHPPLYFVILKLFSLTFGSSIIVIKHFNIIINFLVIIICYHYSEYIGNKKYALFVITIYILFPAIYNEIFQIRMYSFTQLMLLLVGVYAHKAFLKVKSKLTSIIFIIFTITTLYTHYFAVIGVAIIHLILYISLLSRNRKSLKQISLFALIPTISFLPWIHIFFEQLAIKNDNIGDTSSTIVRIIKNIVYIFYTGNYSIRDSKINYILTVLLILATTAVFVLYFKNSNNKRKLVKLYPISVVSLLIPVVIMFTKVSHSNCFCNITAIYKI